MAGGGDGKRRTRRSYRPTVEVMEALRLLSSATPAAPMTGFAVEHNALGDPWAGPMPPVHDRLSLTSEIWDAALAQTHLANLLLGRFAAAREEMQLLIDMYDTSRDGPESGVSSRDPKVSTCTLLGICLTILGYPQSGAAKSRAGIEHAEALNHPVSLNLALRRACVEAMLRRDVDAVAGFAARLAALRAEYETYKGIWEGTFFRDWAQLTRQSAPELFDRTQSFLNHLDAVKNWAFLPWYMASTAELSGRFGAPAAALLERAAELADTTGARWWEPEITRLQARICAPDREAAVTLLETGLAQAREQGGKLWELRIAASLAELRRDGESRAAARDVLEPVCEWFSEGRNMPDYVAARALLAEIS